MKRLTTLFATICIFTILAITPKPADAAELIKGDLYLKEDVTIKVNGEVVEYNDPVLNKGGHILLPMRDFLTSIEAGITWNKADLTASSVRNDQRLDVTIDSKTALVNDEEVKMNVAPLLYQYRTYVPLRFVAENLDTEVRWNQPEQTVEITLIEEEPEIPEPVDPLEGDDFEEYMLHLNNQTIFMEDPVAVRGGRTYIPASYFYENMEESTGNWQGDDMLDLQIGGLLFQFTAGSNVAYVNEERVVMDETPFIARDQMYVPVTFIVKSLGGNVRHLVNDNQLFLYVNSYMFVSDFVEKELGRLEVPDLVPSAEYEGERTLLVSDNPERLTESAIRSDNDTLSYQHVTTTKAHNEHRVYGWHLNELGKKASIAITVENTSDHPITVSNANGYHKTTRNSWFNYDVGLPIADHVLAGATNERAGDGETIEPGETALIQGYTVHADYMVGFLEDIDIEAPAGKESTYNIRSVISLDDTDVTKILNAAVPINPYAAHPRGVWPSSTIVAELPTFSFTNRTIGYNLSNGKTDHLQTAESSLSTQNGSIGNPGHFGVNYKVKIPLENMTDEEQTVKIYLAGRGGLYSGAIKVDGKPMLVPTLQPGEDYVELPSYTVESGTNDELEIELMHAGGVSLPVAIYLDTK